MEPVPEGSEHLSQLETRWEMIFQAHRGPADEAHKAQIKIWERYGEAVRRYLLKAAGDPQSAEDLTQEFALKLLRGDFRGADPARGRFRDLIKRAAINLVIDHRRRQARQPSRSLDGQPESAAAGEDEWLAELDRQFARSWREAILRRAWAGLKATEERMRHPFYTVLRLRADHPELRSAALAERLTATLGRPVDAAWFRQNLARAREKFVQILLEQVAQSLGTEDDEALEDELIALDLHGYCRRGLAAFRARKRPP